MVIELEYMARTQTQTCTLILCREITAKEQQRKQRGKRKYRTMDFYKVSSTD